MGHDFPLLSGSQVQEGGKGHRNQLGRTSGPPPQSTKLDRRVLIHSPLAYIF
jgi:hypothetical protein